MKVDEAVSHVVVQLGWAEVGVGVLILALIQFLLGLWIKARLEGSIKHEYDKKLEELRFTIKAREQAAKVAELLSEVRDGATQVTHERAKRLNRMSWELSLWLPTDIVRELTSSLCFAAGSKTEKEILVAVRKHLLVNPDDTLAADQIVHFTPNA